jgi:hypothetical protein
MAEIDSKRATDKRSASRRGGAPWPPPGADTAWWTQDGGTHTAAHPTSTAPPERSAPDISAPITASEAADSATAEPAPDVSSTPVDPAVAETEADDDATETGTVRVTRRRGPRPASRSNDRPASSRRKKPVDSVDQPKSADSVDQPASDVVAGEVMAAESVEQLAGASAVDGGPTGIDATEPGDVQAVDEPLAVDEPAAEVAVDETAAVAPPAETDEPAAIESVDELDEIEGDAPAAAAEPTESPEEAAVLGPWDDAINDEAINDDATADDEPASQNAPFSVAATIVADGDFVEEPEFAVPDIAAPPSTRRNAPETGFPLRAAPAVRPPARREPVLAAAALPSIARPRTRPAPVPVQVPAHGDSLDDFDFFSGEAGQVPAAFAPTRRRQPIQTGRPHRHRKVPRRPAFGLPALLVFALAAAFFAWVSATPLLLTAGHGKRGVAIVATCSVHGIDRSCAEFVAADRSFSAAVTLLGPASTHASAGQKLDAQMVSRGSSLAYAGNSTDLLLHWIPGVVLLVLCGFGIAWATGALRLTGRRARSLALLGSFGGPILLFAGMLAYAW